MVYIYIALYLLYNPTCISLHRKRRYSLCSHKREVCAACLSVFLSVRTFMIRKYTRVVLIYGVPLVVDSSVYGAFGELLCMSMFRTNRFLY